MKIYFTEVLKREQGICKEIMQTRNNEIFKTKTLLDEEENPYWEVEIKINGVDFDPVIFNSMFTETEEWIKYRAEELVKEKLQDSLHKAENRIRILQDLNEQVIRNLKEEFNVEE